MGKQLPEELRYQLLVFDYKKANKARKLWKKRKGDKDKEAHKKFCYGLGAKLDVSPKVVSFIVKNNKWADQKPAEHVKSLPTGLQEYDKPSLKPEALVRGRELYISPKNWRRLNEHYTKGKIKKAIVRAVRKLDLPAPVQPISQEQADDSFRALKKLRSDSMIKRMPTCTRWDYKYGISDVVIDAPRTGNECSNFYHQESRWWCDYQSIPSPMKVWNSDLHMYSMMNALWTLKFKKITGPELRTAISVRKYVASQFKPSAAKAFYELFDCKHVYDPSSGWGDRLAGFMAAKCTKSYCSTDPNSRLYDDYELQKNRYGGKKEINMYCHGSEIKGGVRKMYGHRVDTVFTSPPYFNAERYSEDEGQSFRQFDEISAWRENFLFPSLKNAWNALTSEGERGGILAINISDIYNSSDKTRGEICDPMNDYISSLKGARYIGCIGLRLAKRPESGALEGKQGASIEPIWVWAKGGSWELDDYIDNGFKTKKVKGLWG